MGVLHDQAMQRRALLRNPTVCRGCCTGVFRRSGGGESDEQVSSGACAGHAPVSVAAALPRLLLDCRNHRLRHQRALPVEHALPDQAAPAKSM